MTKNLEQPSAFEDVPTYASGSTSPVEKACASCDGFGWASWQPFIPCAQCNPQPKKKPVDVELIERIKAVFNSEDLLSDSPFLYKEIKSILKELGND